MFDCLKAKSFTHCFFIVLIVGTFSFSSFSQNASVQQLIDSPRHQEWVEVTYGERTVHAFVVYPEVSERVHTVLVIHENQGLNDWARSLADQVAKKVYIAVAPDLLSGMAPDGGKTSDFPNSNAARDAIYTLEQDQITADLQAVADYAKQIPASNGTISVAGFCWGGTQSFTFATNRTDLELACVFYGTPPESGFENITCPVYGFYGGNDSRVTSTVPDTEETMETAGKLFEAVVYEGAGHGFMRSGEANNASDADKNGRAAAWERWLNVIETNTQGTSGIEYK